jgi:hypothetical protein
MFAFMGERTHVGEIGRCSDILRTFQGVKNLHDPPVIFAPAPFHDECGTTCLNHEYGRQIIMRY